METNSKYHWSEEETACFLSLWSSTEVQNKLEGTTRTKPVFEQIQREMAAAGYNRTTEQISNKLKKLKMEYRDQKKGPRRRRNPHFEILESVLGTRSACQQTGPLYPETAMFEVTVDYPTDNMLVQSSTLSDAPLCSWSSAEVQALVTLWADPSVQEELLLSTRNTRVYTHLSDKLASLGFNKAPNKCREKIKKLKQEYKRIKNGQQEGGRTNIRTSVWFAIMDDVLSSKAVEEQCSETTQPSLLSQTQSVMDVDSGDGTQWLPDEVQVLLTLWAQPNIQQQLLTTATNNDVFDYLSSELAFVGFNKTAQQCSLKVTKLKEEYRKIKEVQLIQGVNSNWFAILDRVLGPDEETSTEVDSSDVPTRPKSPENARVKDVLQVVWTSEEVEVLLSLWAEESVQEQLTLTPRNERVFARLSSDLATQGFDKTTSQCMSKLRLLKQKYRKIKEQKDSEKQKSSWFAIMDKVNSRHKTETETNTAAGVMESASASLQTSQPDPSGTVEDLGCRLSISSLCLLVPTLRLMCAFAWQVVQSCNVLHYGKVEELVRLVTELAPDLLTPREKMQVLLKLRARTVLELCRSESTADLLNVQPHLEVIQNLTMGPSCDQEEQEELWNSKSNFEEVVHFLLENTEERRIFFKEVFPIHYGQQYEATLHSLVWKFVSRLDHLLPVPDIKQTAEWLSKVPSVMDECGRLVLETVQLKELLNFHQQQSGSTNKCYSQTPNMFLPRLSVPPKPNAKQLSSEQLESSAGDDEGQFDYSKDEEPIEENQSGIDVNLEDWSQGDEDLKLKDEESDHLIAANCPDLNQQSQSKLQTCSLCPYSDSQVSGLLQHIRKVHLNQEPGQCQSKESDTGNAPQKVGAKTCAAGMSNATNTCKYCAKAFKSVSTLNGHIKTHTLPFQCDKCDKKYSSREHLNVHRRIHTGETPFLCSTCGRGFRSVYSLRLHVRIHTGDRRYTCHICGKTSIQHLMRHMRMHRGEKNFLCTECGKAFLSSGELRLHMRYHTGERPYACKHCGKGFIAKCHLTVHMRKHTGETPYRCSVCPKSFKTFKGRKRHMKIHLSKKSFQCLKCGKIFRQEDTFKTHVQMHE
ncbi:uncharacterized protein LOC119032725 isoform X1 [Acanthopagrus latus]|uniref:uncharacterized protein LOC119032725 isoform X1 n=1 Tax=Acanthopagrus latus TaxID=8177 RepID=UPI00187C84A6|nr:uncharacterized protein LOC119032725 isoform X1 [Acanthopagrus latus]